MATVFSNDPIQTDKSDETDTNKITIKSNTDFMTEITPREVQIDPDADA